MGNEPHFGRRGSGRGDRRRGLSALAIGAVVITTTATGLPVAGAQSTGPGSVDPGSLVPSVAPGSLLGAPSLSIAASTQLGAPIPVTSVLGSVGAIGSSDFPRPGSSQPPAGPRLYGKAYQAPTV